MGIPLICTCTSSTTLYRVKQLLEQTLKICKKSNFDRNQLKLSTQHKFMYMYQKM